MIEAIQKEFPNAVSIEWNPNKPSFAFVDGVRVEITQAIEQHVAVLQAEYDANEYIRERKKLHESKSPYEQIEMIVDDLKLVLQGGTFMTWYEVNKTKFPKP